MLVGLYISVLSAMALYGLHRLWMLAHFRWEHDAVPELRPGDAPPHVTVQLPLYEERTVAARLIRAAGELDWPADSLEIQILDDSSDETRGIVESEVKRLRARGIDAKVLRRPDRAGFKAGALAHGLAHARGELVAVFDADFLPQPSFLRALVPHFADARVGMVQARWEHENREENALTRAQATLLDGHFVIEHKFRADQGLFFNFNGTAGIWRRAAIESSGGWQHDTLTEDLDLSYRAQLAGWRFVYAPQVATPAEVPQGIAALKGQQQRWAKGSVQVARKLGGRIARADLPFAVKLEAFAHLTGNVGYPFVLALAILLPLVAREQEELGVLWHLGLFVIGTLSVVLFYDRSQRALGRSRRARLFDVPAALALGIGMCVSQTRAVLEGLRGASGEFVRTPKSGDAPVHARYCASVQKLPAVELLLALWFGGAIVGAARSGVWGTLPFLGLFFAGFAWVGSLSLAEWMRERGTRRGRIVEARAGVESPSLAHSDWIVSPPEARSSTR